MVEAEGRVVSGFRFQVSGRKALFSKGLCGFVGRKEAVNSEHERGRIRIEWSVKDT